MADPDDTEEWRGVEGYPDYVVSSLGRVKRIGGVVHRPASDKDGYRLVAIRALAGRRSKTNRICILVCHAFNGPKPSLKHQVAHDDGDNTNDKASNLFWRTAKQNAADRERHGRTRRGEKHARSKLSEADVVAIRQCGGMTLRALAADYGVSHHQILRIKEGFSWKHIATKPASQKKNEINHLRGE